MLKANGAYWRLLWCVLLPFVLSLSPATPTISASVDDERYSEGGGSDEHGNGAIWRISSVAEPLSESQVCDKFHVAVFVAPPTDGLDQEWESPGPFLYCYRYTIQNAGEHRIKVSLPGPEVIRSPLNKVIQDFAVEVDAHDSVTLAFLAESDPRESLSPVDIAIWDVGTNRWGFIRSGPVSLLLPSRPNLVGVDAARSR
jgi:hypothetical protein